MGKNLKGRECGKGIYQRKDGYYSARFYAKNGKREEKYFDVHVTDDSLVNAVRQFEAVMPTS